jgi:protein-S-isoprenylcysteine O-methyltransferase Ste14
MFMIHHSVPCDLSQDIFILYLFYSFVCSMMLFVKSNYSETSILCTRILCFFFVILCSLVWSWTNAHKNNIVTY